jgi:ComEC/Rec2-related protein
MLLPVLVIAFAAGALLGWPASAQAAALAAAGGIAAAFIPGLPAGIGRVLLAVAALSAGGLVRPSDRQASEPPSAGGIYKGKVSAVTASGAMMERRGLPPVWIPGRLWERSVMLGDSLDVLGWRRGRFLTASAVRARQDGGPVRRLRGRLAAVMEARLAPRQVSSIAQTVLLGYRGRLPQELRRSFREGGVIHLLAVSGLHAGMVAALALLLLRRLAGKGWLSAAGACLAVCAYAAVTGMRPSAMRAAVMASAALVWLQAAGDRPDLLWLWGAAAAVVLAADPRAVFDPGAQMSFGAVLALIAAGRRFSFRPRPLAWAADGLYAGLVVTVALAPLVTSCYGEMRPLGPLLTVVSLPLLMSVMVMAPAAMLPAAGAPFAAVLEWLVYLWTRAVGWMQGGGVAVEGGGPLLLWVLALALLLVFRRWNGLHRRLR